MTASTITLNPGTGGASPLVDTLTTVDGAGAPAGASAQMVKVGNGAASDFKTFSFTNPLPVTGALNTSVTLTFTAADAAVAAPIGDGTLITGASTAGSVIGLVIPDGFIGWTLLLKNWANGTVYTEASTNSTNGTDGDWVEVKGRRTGTAPGTESVIYAMVANGYYRGNGAGFTRIRARFVGGTTFPTASFQLTTGLGATFLNSGIPGGSSAIGSVSLNAALPAGANTVGAVKLTDGIYAAALDGHGQLQISGAVLQQLMQLGVEQLRQLTKISLILASMSGVFIEDDDIEPLTF